MKQLRTVDTELNDANGYYDRLKSLNKISQILDQGTIIAASDKYKYRKNLWNFDVLYDKLLI